MKSSSLSNVSAIYMSYSLNYHINMHMIVHSHYYVITKPKIVQTCMKTLPMTMSSLSLKTVLKMTVTRSFLASTYLWIHHWMMEQRISYFTKLYQSWLVTPIPNQKNNKLCLVHVHLNSILHQLTKYSMEHTLWFSLKCLKKHKLTYLYKNYVHVLYN